MYKLLTKESRQEISREYRMRRVSIMLALLALLALFALLSLFPSLIIAHGVKRSALFFKEEAGTLAQSPDKATLDAWIRETKRDLAILSADLVPDKSYEYFQKALGAKPQDVKIVGLSSSKGREARSVVVKGIADSREALLRFESNLKASGDWSQVDLPVSALAADTDVEFEITLTSKE